MPRTPTAVCSVRRLKLNDGNAQHEYDHNMRIDIPENAHEDLMHLNRVFVDQPEGRPIAEYLDEEIYNLRLENPRPQKTRKDAVGTVAVTMRANNVFLKDGQPPEWFDLEGWVQDSINWADRTFNPPDHEIHFMDAENHEQTRKVQNIYSAVLHMDEANPHIHILLMPIDEKGHLNSHGTAAIRPYSQMQTDYHQAVEKYGLSRGTLHSPAKAKNISLYHENLERQMSQEAPEIIPGETIEAYRARATDAIRVCSSHMIEQDREHEKELNAAIAEKNRYVRQDYKLHSEINRIIGNGNGKDLDLELIRDMARDCEKYRSKYQKIEEAIRRYPDREFAGVMEADMQHLLQWIEEQERQEAERKADERERTRIEYEQEEDIEEREEYFEEERSKDEQEVR